MIGIIGISQTVSLVDPGGAASTELIVQNLDTGARMGIPVTDDTVIDVLSLAGVEVDEDVPAGSPIQDEVEEGTQL